MEENVFSNPCAICKKREATQLCDYVIDYDHNPIFTRDFKSFKALNEEVRTESCDLPMCKECSHDVQRADICPHHYELYKQRELPDKYRKYQRRTKLKLYSSQF